MRQQALEWIREIVAGEAESPSVSLVDFDLARERLHHSRFQQAQVYRVEARLWESAGVAHIDGRRARYPVDLDPWDRGPPPRPECPSEPLSPEALASVSRATSGLGPERVLRCGTWAEDARGLWVWVQRQEPDARLAVELDPQSGLRLGSFLPFRARGSRRAAALSRPRAVQEARARLKLPQEAVQVYTRLIKRRDVRVWNLRWLVGEGPWRGEVRAELNARTGQVIESELRLKPRRASRVVRPEGRERAQRALRKHVREVLGRRAELGPVVPGTSESGERACWLAVVRSPKGTRRATYCAGEISLGPWRSAS